MHARTRAQTETNRELAATKDALAATNARLTQTRDELEEMARRREDAQSVYAAAAAERDLARRREVARLLGSLGVEVLDVDADALPAALVDHYLALKAAGRL